MERGPALASASLVSSKAFGSQTKDSGEVGPSLPGKLQAECRSKLRLGQNRMFVELLLVQALLTTPGHPRKQVNRICILSKLKVNSHLTVDPAAKYHNDC